MRYIFSFANIYGCYLACRRNKRNTINALKFEINAEENILKLENELKSKIYRPSRSILFAARNPKLREIFAADFRDRVVHHILVDYLERIWERIFIHDSYACRKGKGTHAAVMRLQSFLQKASKNGSARAYYLQLDIKDFFTSIDKGILFKTLQKKIRDKEALWLTEKIIFWDCTRSFILRDREGVLKNIPPHKSIFGKDNKRGLPIGNLTSQFFANVYLNELDQFVKHTLKARFYIRYVDDFVLLSDNINTLIKWRQDIETFLAEKLLLRLHPNRRKLQPISNGIDFLGYIIRRDYILVRRRVINNLKSRLRRFARMAKSEIASSRGSENGTLLAMTPSTAVIAKALLSPSLRGGRSPTKQSQDRLGTGYANPKARLLQPLSLLRNDNRSACVQSYLAHFKWADSYNLVKSLGVQNPGRRKG
ncbi:MAG: reverse transcriptase/maturase family protein [Candidatus Omnitrophota bacterium]|nr:reverse transcriptase/maturase family protein [Candidatus Omnitrophota bacterium]